MSDDFGIWLERAHSLVGREFIVANAPGADEGIVFGSEVVFAVGAAMINRNSPNCALRFATSIPAHGQRGGPMWVDALGVIVQMDAAKGGPWEGRLLFPQSDGHDGPPVVVTLIGGEE